MSGESKVQPEGTPTRRIVAGLFMSLDGVVASPDEWAFQYMDAEMGKSIGAGIAHADAVLLGRRTYESFSRMWPSQGSEVPMSDFLNHSPKYVVSSTLRELPWQPATLIRGDLVAEIKKLKSTPGGAIQVPGSPTLVCWLLNQGLLDQLTLTICPVVVATGLRLFDGMSHQVRLKLVHSAAAKTGAVGVTYQPALAAEPPAQPAVTFPREIPSS